MEDFTYDVLSFFKISKSARISISSSRIGCSRGSDGRLNNGVSVIVDAGRQEEVSCKII